MKLTLSFFFSLLMISGLWAQDYKKLTDKTACKAAIEKKHKSISTLSADFSESTYSSMFKTPKKGSGTLHYKKKDKIRWEHTAPNKQVILINGKTVKLSENGKEVTNATSKQVVKKIQNMMVQMISGDFLNEKDFTIVYYESNSNYKLVLTPKNDRMKKYIKHVDLIFDKKALTLKEMTMAESDTEKVVYTFSNTKLNETINDSKFTTL
jgi:outer membrane lipoprotein carrier protein